MDAAAATSPSFSPTPKTNDFPAQLGHFLFKPCSVGYQNNIHVGVCGGFVGVFSLNYPEI
jgi:hypothetical protein